MSPYDQMLANDWERHVAEEDETEVDVAGIAGELREIADDIDYDTRFDNQGATTVPIPTLVRWRDGIRALADRLAEKE